MLQEGTPGTHTVFLVMDFILIAQTTGGTENRI